MADDLHTQIVDAVKAALESTDVPSIDNVFGYLAHAQDPELMPYLMVWAPRDDAQRESGGGGEDTLTESLLELRVAGFVKVEEPEPVLNQIKLEVQQVLAAGIQIGGVQVNFDYRGCEKAYEGREADQDYSEIEMRFEAEIAFEAGAPDVLAWR
jgi:hypothetical protein